MALYRTPTGKVIEDGQIEDKEFLVRTKLLFLNLRLHAIAKGKNKRAKRYNKLYCRIKEYFKKH